VQGQNAIGFHERKAAETENKRRRPSLHECGQFGIGFPSGAGRIIVKPKATRHGIPTGGIQRGEESAAGCQQGGRGVKISMPAGGRALGQTASKPFVLEMVEIYARCSAHRQDFPKFGDELLKPALPEAFRSDLGVHTRNAGDFRGNGFTGEERMANEKVCVLTRGNQILNASF
jgi:hypothetical protein